ncbi:23S rRNA m(5)U-1939 methyltransferase [Modicisalibacter muralis]|uniref:23S rRNA (uracil(1939)-C(5))-methyltransferase RlmD n=1 Tax=Modicisalibacter muralis TaxID=119000 RepID=A0A1G9M7R4_9GAMM|nr:23S rRNA (uracil(1939)-C(5))-methyltransferase RlmD [Halomonas muralis]SDL70258.1 23S rRNA m(5)U-1939 methyltransferase [Halomonas muralis]
MAMLGKRRPERTPSRRSLSANNGAEDERDERAGLSILRLAHDGRGVARDAAGKTLFVDQALPGERVSVAVHRSRKRFDEAHVREWLQTSPERVTPACVHYTHCGGCDLQHLALEGQRRHKREVLIDQLARQGVALASPPSILAGSAWGYRRRARLGVKVDAKGQAHLGFRARGSHHLIDIEECPILVPRLAALLAPLRQRLGELAAPRQVGHIELIDGDDGVAVVVRQLRANPEDARAWQGWAEAQGVRLALFEGRENPALRWLGCSRAPELRYTLLSEARQLTLEFAPGDFLQVNAEVNQALVSTALDWLRLTGAERVLDLFAGVGNFTLALAAHVAEVVAMEGSQAMVERLASNARRNDLHNIQARQADLARAPLLEPFDLVVLDPPRDGAESVCRALAESTGAGTAPRVLYVSCDAATLARDAACLVQGGYRITHAAIADMFVQTAHLESMLLFERERG